MILLLATLALYWCTYLVANVVVDVFLMVLSLNFTQVLQLIAVPTLAEAVVESFLTVLDVQGLSLLSSAAQIMELESTAASTVKMLESDVQVVCDCVVSVFLPVCHCIQC